ncbi:MAG TPA: nitrile hydratase accessory protein [Burkholderiales bacterium]|nr:nitrile hydratase accessory protein [Burkholderiales bacterium]
MTFADPRAAGAAFSELRDTLPQLLRDDEGPVFRAPWEAQAFAMTLTLYERGLFSWKEWADALAQAISNAQAAGDPDTGENYYLHWLDALETITRQKGLVTGELLAQRKQEWDEAARRTPHGKPIELKRG